MTERSLADGDHARSPFRSRYLIGIELQPGEIAPLAAADSLVWGQVQLIQIVAARRVLCGDDVLVLVDVFTGHVHERIRIPPAHPTD
jgi:hypothetical protein